MKIAGGGEVAFWSRLLAVRSFFLSFFTWSLVEAFASVQGVEEGSLVGLIVGCLAWTVLYLLLLCTVKDGGETELCLCGGCTGGVLGCLSVLMGHLSA